MYAETVRKSRLTTCNRYSTAQAGNVSINTAAILHPTIDHRLIIGSSRNGLFRETWRRSTLRSYHAPLPESTVATGGIFPIGRRDGGASLATWPRREGKITRGAHSTGPGTAVKRFSARILREYRYSRGCEFALAIGRGFVLEESSIGGFPHPENLKAMGHWLGRTRSSQAVKGAPRTRWMPTASHAC